MVLVNRIAGIAMVVHRIGGKKSQLRSSSKVSRRRNPHINEDILAELPRWDSVMRSALTRLLVRMLLIKQ
jgi:hypothetical protein